MADLLCSVNLLSGTLEGATRVFRLVELIIIPPIDGNVKVVIYRHPGNNSLSSYMSVYERRGSFLPGTVSERENASQSNITVDTAEDSKLPEVPSVIHESHSREEVMGRSIDVSSDCIAAYTLSDLFLQLSSFLQ
jgi:hypothetical protein